MEICIICEKDVGDDLGHAYVEIKNKFICSHCGLKLIEPIYRLGCGGLTHLAYSEMLTTMFNRKKRTPIKNYKSTLNKLLHKYNFQCVVCEAADNLTIDHIKPVSKGGSDDYINLQIMCKNCNSKKGAKYG